MKKETIAEIISFLFIILFLYTGISKLMDYTLFKEQISTSPILQPVAASLAWLLPLTELAVCLALFIPKYRLQGLYSSLVLMVLFTVYILFILSFNNKLPCSCGGVIELLSWKAHILFNVVFIALAIIGILQKKSA